MTIELFKKLARSSILVYEISNLSNDNFCRFLLCSCQDLYQLTVQSIAEELSRTGCHFNSNAALSMFKCKRCASWGAFLSELRCLDGATSPGSDKTFGKFPHGNLIRCLRPEVPCAAEFIRIFPETDCQQQITGKGGRGHAARVGSPSGFLMIMGSPLDSARTQSGMIRSFAQSPPPMTFPARAVAKPRWGPRPF